MTNYELFMLINMYLSIAFRSHYSVRNIDKFWRNTIIQMLPSSIRVGIHINKYKGILMMRCFL